MTQESSYQYVIIGAGLAGASAVEGIREVDENGTILLIGDESHLPYNRPPLSKKLWTGEKKVSEIVVHGLEYYDDRNVDLTLGFKAVHLDPNSREITLGNGENIEYGKLLLSMGGISRRLTIPGGDLDGICYYRRLDDYWKLKAESEHNSNAIIIGGGYIASEIAAALNMQGVEVTVIMRGEWLCRHLFPESLGRSVMKDYTTRGVNFMTGDEPSEIERKSGGFVVKTKGGKTLETHTMVVGIGVHAAVALAEETGIKVDDGVVVNEFLQSSDPSIYAAGDIANFPYRALGDRRRVEHWDNALNSGKYAGWNMAGKETPYDYMPYFFSDLFDLGFEAVGDVSTRLEAFADWQKENEKGVIYYLKDSVVRGAMVIGVWDKVDDARELIRKGGKMSGDDLRGAIK